MEKDHKEIEIAMELTRSYLSCNKLERIEDAVRLFSLFLTELKNCTKPQQEITDEKKEEIKNSIQPDYIVCLEDGRKLRTLKNYLNKKYNMTPHDYRQKWGLPSSYPMSCTNYSQKRAEIARKTKLGHKK